MKKSILSGALLAELERDGNAARVARALLEKALAGDARAFELVRNTIGEKPAGGEGSGEIRIRWGGDDA